MDGPEALFTQDLFKGFVAMGIVLIMIPVETIKGTVIIPETEQVEQSTTQGAQPVQ